MVFYHEAAKDPKFPKFSDIYINWPNFCASFRYNQERGEKKTPRDQIIHELTMILMSCVCWWSASHQWSPEPSTLLIRSSHLIFSMAPSHSLKYESNQSDWFKCKGEFTDTSWFVKKIACYHFSLLLFHRHLTEVFKENSPF